MALTLRRNIAWTSVGNGVYAACQWGMLIVVARFGGPKAVGCFALALAITAPVMIFSNLALRQILATDAEEAHPFADYLAVRATSSILGLFAVAGIALFAFPLDTAAVIILVGLAKTFEAGSDIFYGLEQRHERLDRVARSLMVRGVFGLVSLGIGYVLGGTLVWGVLGMSAAWAMVMLMLDIPNALPVLHRQYCLPDSDCPPRSRYKRSRQLAWLALPLGLAAMLVSLNTNIPRYFIEWHLGEEALGLFAAMAYLVVAGGMLITAVWQAASPRLGNYYFVGDVAAFWRLLSRMLILALSLGVAGVLMALFFGRELLTLLYGRKFEWDENVFVWIMVVGTIHYVSAYFGSALIPLRMFRIRALVLVTVTGVNALSCLLLIPKYGLRGAVWAWAVALSVYLLFSLIFSMYRLHILSKTTGEPRVS